MFTFYLLQAKAESTGFGGFQFIFLGLMILVFWLFFIRPQAKGLRTRKCSLRTWAKVKKSSLLPVFTVLSIK